MTSSVKVISLRQLEAVGGLADGYSFDDYECPLNVEVQDFLRKKAVQARHG